MRMYDIIRRKRAGGALSGPEIHFFVEGFTKGEIPDYQMSALLMAICFAGMTAGETAELTMAMARSGEMADLSAIPGIKVDKHSTGGVGDKTTLIVAPLAAACGVTIAKMSGRGLGHTGGTVDKLEAIPGFRTAMSQGEFFHAVQTAGLAVIGQTGNLAPADKKLYALRDVTATVDSLPLIASSIMSKKIAAGADAIVLDVKVGSGAFMKSLDQAVELAQAMVAIGEEVGRRTVALLTNMDIPLGQAVGNALEVAEAVETLRGHGPADLTQVCLALAANMVYLAGKGDMDRCRALVLKALEDGSGLGRLRAMVEAQGGDASVLDHLDRLPQAPVVREVLSPQAGWIAAMDTEAIGAASVVLGAGRETKESPIDPGAGIVLLRKTGDYVEAGQPLARLFTSREELVAAAGEKLLGALTFGPEKPTLPPLIQARVSRDGVEKYDAAK